MRGIGPEVTSPVPPFNSAWKVRKSLGRGVNPGEA